MKEEQAQAKLAHMKQHYGGSFHSPGDALTMWEDRGRIFAANMNDIKGFDTWEAGLAWCSHLAYREMEEKCLKGELHFTSGKKLSVWQDARRQLERMIQFVDARISESEQLKG